MDWAVIAQKLESLRRCLRRIADRCPLDPETLENDVDLQDIVVLNLTRAVQLCVDIGTYLIADMEVSPPDTMGQVFDILAHADIIPEAQAAQMKKAIGFRNIAVHNYEEINWLIVHAIALHHLEDFTEFAKVIASRMNVSEPK